MGAPVSSTESYDAQYFSTLYGEEPQQTWADRVRDRRIFELVRRYGPQSSRGGSLLDIGCGFGYLLGRFRGRFSLYGLDVSQHAVEQAVAHMQDANFAQADIQQGIPFDETFQVIMAVNVIEHLIDPLAAVRQLRDALHPDGLCVVHLPTVNNPLNRLIYALTYSKDKSHIYRPSGESLGRLFSLLGFTLLEESYSPHRPQFLCNVLKPHPAYLAVFRRGP